MEAKKVLIVFAHQESKSFNGALRDVAIETLQGEGHEVMISDLYEMRFDPTASKYAFKERDNEDKFDFQHELCIAAKNNRLPEDLKAEVDKILAADLVILQFPMYWLGLPAILKGWIDRCFADGVCFDTQRMKWFDDGPFKNKKLVLSMTTGGTAGYFTDMSLFGDIDVILWPIQNALRMPGFQIMTPQISYGPADVTEAQRGDMLAGWKTRLQNIWTEKPLEFIHLKHFEAGNEFRLSKSFMEEHNNDRDVKCTAGQNFGRLKRPLSKCTESGDCGKC